MAEDKKIAIEIEVNGTEESINSVKDLKNAIKAAKDEQVKAAAVFGESSKEFVDASKKVSALKDKVDDLADSTNSLKGSGVERASEGFNQLGEGLRNLDFDKVKVGLTALRSALAATGIMLIVQAVGYLIANFDELSKGSSGLSVALRIVGEYVQFVFGNLMKLANAITDFIGLTSEAERAIEAQGEAIVATSKKTKAALDEQVQGFDNQIAAAKAAGKNTVELERQKQEAIIETNKKLAEQIIAFVKSGGQLTEEQKKAFDENIKSIKDAIQAKKIIDITDKKEQLDRHKKLLEDKQKADDEAWQLTLQIRQSNREAQEADDKRILEEKKAQEAADRQAQLDAISESNSQEKVLQMSNSDFNKELRRTEFEELRGNYNTQIQVAQQTTQSLQQLSDAYFHFKTKNLQKGSAEELKQAKKQFDINKGIAIANATISGIQGVVNALSAQSVIPEPFGSILKAVTAVTVGVAAAANISKIASQKFNPSGGGGGGGVAAVAVPSPPTINTPSANTNSSTSFDETGKKVGGEKEPIKPTINVNSTVSVKEINDKQNDVKVLEEQSTFK
jgi:chromosome segregation ATPase